jgi:hypothetical protein
MSSGSLGTLNYDLYSSKLRKMHFEKVAAGEKIRSILIGPKVEQVTVTPRFLASKFSSNATHAVNTDDCCHVAGSRRHGRHWQVPLLEAFLTPCRRLRSLL